MKDKRELRKFFLSRRAALPDKVRKQADAAICEQLRSLECCRNAECLALYASDGEEPDLSSLYGWKRSFFPRYAEKDKAYELVEIHDPETDLVRGRYGLLEPRPELEAAASDFVGSHVVFLTPAVSCTRRGVRLGRGGGFYDRMLAGGARGVIGVVYSCQMAEELPEEPHDSPLDFVVTESEVWNCKKKQGN